MRDFLAGALSLAQAEPFTSAWYALRTEPNVSYIVDAFGSGEDRTRHLQGDIAKALFAKADDLGCPREEIARVYGETGILVELVA